MSKTPLALISQVLIFLATAVGVLAQTPPQLVPLGTPQLWHRTEFRITNVPAATNPFDPDNIRVDATFTLPSARTVTVPAFWYQGYQRNLSAGNESIAALGTPEWRLRYTPGESGVYSVSLTVQTNGQSYGAAAVTNFIVPAAALSPGVGFVRAGTNRQYFETSDGQALRLVGENMCWPGGRGTYDYDDWFAAMQAVGENYARIWMCPWSCNLETDPNSLTHYRPDAAWRLDYVLALAEQRGIYLLLCLDFHGMFEVVPDYWGGDNYWTNNPYNAINGGPCVDQNSFFTSGAAQRIYQKRLRYLVARYGASPNLLAWEFFNEIDNVYAYLNPNDVAAWHGLMGGWMHANDPFGHLVTTSLTGSSDRPELWTVPQLDFAAYHSYAEPGPATRLEAVAQSFLSRYQKPVMIGEFGTDPYGWARTNDPSLRGLRQGIWGGALGGSVGTAMSWWWENLDSENVYPVYASLGAILNRTGWGRGAWTNIGFRTTGAAPPTVGDPIPGGQPFDAFLSLSGLWGGLPAGQLAIPDPAAAADSASSLNSFVQGVWHADLKAPFRLSAWLTNNARLVMHLNSVSDGSIMVVRADGTELFRTNLANLDGAYTLDNEYNLDIPINLPAGKRLIEITNAGNDWFFLDWVRLEQVLPATYVSGWLPSPDSIGLRGPHESLVYVVAPGAAFPSGATNVSLPLQSGQTVTLTNWPAGEFNAEWYDPSTGARIGSSQARTTNALLTLALPGIREDVAGIIYPPPGLTALGLDGVGGFQMRLDSESGGHYAIEQSSDFTHWTPWRIVTNDLGVVQLTVPSVFANPRTFFRARQTE